MYKLYKGGLSGEKKRVEAGNGKSDSTGSFEILCDFYGQPNYYFKEDDLPVDVFIFPKKQGEQVNLDTLYVLP